MIPRKYFGYIRVSTQKQGEKGVSLQEQKDAIQRFAPHQGLEIIQWFEERETAAKRGRPIFLEMLKQLRKGKAEGAVIHKIDRSARNLKDWADLGELIDQGVVIRFANEDVDMKTRGGRLSADIQAVVAADYIRNLREETKKGMYGRLKQGFYPWKAPLGYLDRGKAKLKEIDPERGPLIRKAFELYATAKFNLLELNEEMFRLGLRTRTGARLSLNGLANNLNNTFYIGIIRIKRNGQTYPGIHQPLISPALFQRVQDVLRGKVNLKVQKHDFAFSRLIKCATCKYHLVGERQKGWTYYRCHTSTCPITSVREDRVHAEILLHLEPFQFTDAEWRDLRNETQALREKWESDAALHLKAIRLRLEEIKERYTRLTDAFLDRIIEKDVYEERKTSMLMDRMGLENKLRELQSGEDSIPAQIADFAEFAGTVYPAYHLGLPEERRDLLNSITSNRMVDGKKLELVLLPPFQMIANRTSIPYCAQERI